MLSLIVGILFLAVGLMGIYRWPYETIIFLKGFIPISFVAGGAIVALVGFLKIISKRDDLSVKKIPESDSSKTK